LKVSIISIALLCLAPVVDLPKLDREHARSVRTQARNLPSHERRAFTQKQLSDANTATRHRAAIWRWLEKDKEDKEVGILPSVSVYVVQIVDNSTAVIARRADEPEHRALHYSTEIGSGGRPFTVEQWITVPLKEYTKLTIEGWNTEDMQEGKSYRLPESKVEKEGKNVKRLSDQ